MENFETPCFKQIFSLYCVAWYRLQENFWLLSKLSETQFYLWVNIPKIWILVYSVIVAFVSIFKHIQPILPNKNKVEQEIVEV